MLEEVGRIKGPSMVADDLLRGRVEECEAPSFVDHEHPVAQRFKDCLDRVDELWDRFRLRKAHWLCLAPVLLTAVRDWDLRRSQENDAEMTPPGAERVSPPTGWDPNQLLERTIDVYRTGGALNTQSPSRGMSTTSK